MSTPTTDLRLPNKVSGPPGGWRYRVPETGQVFRGASEHQLDSSVIAHYKANNLIAPLDLKARYEAFICEQEPDYCVDMQGRPATRIGFFHSLQNVLQGTKTLALWKLSGGDLVPAAQAEQRAQVCASCSLNDEPQGCTACNSKTIKDTVLAIVGERRTSVHDRLKACRVCSCFLQAKVQLPHSSIWPHMTDEQKAKLPAPCWLLREAASSDTPTNPSPL